MNQKKDATHYLRHHEFGITALCTGTLDAIFNIYSPILISADEKGSLTIWDLVIRRPLFSKRLCEAQIVAIQFDEGKYISFLAKDHKFRMFELYPNKSIDIKINSHRSNDLMFLKQVFEVPVNTMNFANFGLISLGDDRFQLVTSHTQDAHFLDIYEFQIPELHSLKRIFKRVDLIPLIKLKYGTDLLPKIEGLGIIMRILCVDDIIFCGFESGFIVGLRRYTNESTYKKGTKIKQIDVGVSTSNLGKLLSSGSDKYFENEEKLNEILEIVLVDTAHCAEPVLSMVYNSSTKSILSSSTTNSIIIENCTKDFLSARNCDQFFSESEYYVDTTNHMLIRRSLKLNKNIKKETPCKNIGFLATIEGNVIFGSWSGKTYEISGDNNEAIPTAVKDKSSIFVTESAVGNTQNTQNGSGEKVKKSIKIGALTALCISDLSTFQKSLADQKVLSPGQKRRTMDFITNSWLFIGYEDGSVAMYKK